MRTGDGGRRARLLRLLGARIFRQGDPRRPQRSDGRKQGEEGHETHPVARRHHGIDGEDGGSHEPEAGRCRDAMVHHAPSVEVPVRLAARQPERGAALRTQIPSSRVCQFRDSCAPDNGRGYRAPQRCRSRTQTDRAGRCRHPYVLYAPIQPKDTSAFVVAIGPNRRVAVIAPVGQGRAAYGLSKTVTFAGGVSHNRR
jgi:hypothetical protein